MIHRVFWMASGFGLAFMVAATIASDLSIMLLFMLVSLSLAIIASAHEKTYVALKIIDLVKKAKALDAASSRESDS